MKKNVFILFLIAFTECITVANAQKITIGIKGGLNLSSLSESGSESSLYPEYSSCIGEDYGLYGEYHFTNRLSVSVGIEHALRGGENDKMQIVPWTLTNTQKQQLGTNNLYADYDNKLKINYLMMPILGRLTLGFSKKSPFSLYVAAGPFVSILLNAHRVMKGTNYLYKDESGNQKLNSISFDETDNIKSDIKSFNAGVKGLVGILWKTAQRSSLFIEGGGDCGLIPILKDNANGKNYTKSITFTFGYAYSF
jgi:hypothetical protein